MQKYPTCCFDCDVQESNPNSEVLLPQWMCQAMNRAFHIHVPLAACGVTEQMLIRPGDRTPMFMHMLLSKTNWCMSHEHCSDCVVSAYVEWLERNCLFCCAVFWLVVVIYLLCIYETLKSAFWSFFYKKLQVLKQVATIIAAKLELQYFLQIEQEKKQKKAWRLAFVKIWFCVGPIRVCIIIHLWIFC